MATSFSGGGSQSTRTTTDHREASGKLYHYRIYGIKYKIFHEQLLIKSSRFESFAILLLFFVLSALTTSSHIDQDTCP
jgi:hypothetical protein